MKLFSIIVATLLVALASGEIKTRPKGADNPEIKLFNDKVLNVSGNPTILNVNLHVLDIAEIDDDEQEFKVTLYLRHKWVDPSQKSSPNLVDISKIWTPDTFFVNERQGRMHDVTTKNVFARNEGGNITYSVKYTVKLACDMDHKRFPFDKQFCGFEIESYGHKMSEIVYKWDDNVKEPVTVGYLNIKPFRMEGYGFGYCNRELTTGPYSCLRVQFLFARGGAGRAILQVILPLGVLTLLSFCTLICCAQRCRRMLMGTIFFIIVLLTAPFVVQLGPETRDSTSLDCWAAWCIVLAALPPLIMAFAASAEAKHARAQKARGYETCAEDGNKTLELLSPPFIDSEKEESNGADLSAAQAINAGQPVKTSPGQSRCVFARLGLTGDKIERILGLTAFIVLILVFVVYGVYYGVHPDCYESLSTEQKKEYLF